MSSSRCLKTRTCPRISLARKTVIKGSAPVIRSTGGKNLLKTQAMKSKSKAGAHHALPPDPFSSTQRACMKRNMLADKRRDEVIHVVVAVMPAHRHRLPCRL